MRPLRYLNGRTLSPVPAEARHPLRGEPAAPTSRIPLAVAQSLYMWHRFQTKAGGARKDAFKSLVLAALPGWRGPDEAFNLTELAERVAQAAQMNPIKIRETVRDAVADMVSQGLLLKEQGETTLVCTQAALELNRKYSDQFSSLHQEFMRQVELDFQQLVPSATTADRMAIQAHVTDAISAAFTERGAEIVQMAFDGRAQLRPTTNLFKVIATEADSLPTRLKYPFIAYLTRLLTDPRGVQERYLAYLSK